MAVGKHTQMFFAIFERFWSACHVMFCHFPPKPLIRRFVKAFIVVYCTFRKNISTFRIVDITQSTVAECCRGTWTTKSKVLAFQ
jgi:hypothetical protein